MPEYNRDKTVAAVTSFYEFLTRTHIDESTIQRPPETGWPDLTDEYLNGVIKKSPVVNDLVRHLPCIRSRGGDGTQIHVRTFVNHPAGDSAWHPDPQADMGLCSVPPHVLTFAYGRERSGFDLMLDTGRGTITMFDYQNAPGFETELSDVVGTTINLMCIGSNVVIALN